jgi:hypothetical protein
MTETNLRTVQLGNRPLQVRLSSRAAAALANQREPLAIELELYFSCLLRKRVNFLAARRDGVTLHAPLSEQVEVSFRPVMTKHCTVGEVVDAPDVETFPLQRVEAFTPRWLELDHDGESWRGDFGFSD